MKIRKNHIHLFILLFAVSSLLVHFPSEAFAEEGVIATISVGLEGEKLPLYVKNLAQWVVEDKIDLADLIIAIEYIINAQ